MNIYKLITYTLAIAAASHQALSSRASNKNEVSLSDIDGTILNQLQYDSQELQDLHDLNKSPISSKVKKLDTEERTYKQKDGLLIYSSKGGFEQNLNAEAKNSDNERIICRHLAFYLASQDEGIKNYHEAFSSVESIESIPALKNNDFDKQQQDIRDLAMK